MRNANLFARLAEGFPADRHAVLLETRDGVAWSFGRMLDLTGRMTTVLRAAGVAAGDRVAAQAEKSPEAVCLYLACLQTGAVHVPLDPGYSPSELGYFIDDAEPRVVVCDPEAEGAIAPAARAVGASVYTLGADGSGRLSDEARALPSDRAVAARAGGDLAAILYASGSGGRSRGAMLTHDNLWSNLATLHWLWGILPGDVLIHALPLHEADGLFVALNLMLLNGGGTILLGDRDAEGGVAILPRASLLMGAPDFYARLLARPDLTPEAAAGVRLFVSPSAALSGAVREAFEARTGRRVLEGHGRPETGVIASNLPAGPWRAGSAGPALPGVGLRVTGPDGAILGPDRAGALEVRGASVCQGYWRSPDATAEAFRDDGWFVTGDHAVLGADGCVTLVGREGDLSGAVDPVPGEAGRGGLRAGGGR